ncbi:hypothetical protein Tco_1497670, partial [Tanacetum coccineum]
VSTEVECNDRSSDGTSKKNGLADADANLMIKLKFLTYKISLVGPNKREDVQLPANTKSVWALCVKPGTRLALLASLGNKLSVIR